MLDAEGESEAQRAVPEVLRHGGRLCRRSILRNRPGSVSSVADITASAPLRMILNRLKAGGVAVTQRGLRGSPPGVQFNQYLAHRGDVVFEHACKMGLEGIVSKRLGSRYAPVAPATGSSSRTRQRPRWASARLPLQRRTIGRLVTANISLDTGTLAKRSARERPRTG